MKKYWIESLKFVKKNEVQNVVLFGSRAKGTYHEKSDFDIAVSGVKDMEELREQIEGTIVEKYCKTIVETYIDVLFEFQSTVEKLKL